jgi:hypothetical protein
MLLNFKLDFILIVQQQKDNIKNISIISYLFFRKSIISYRQPTPEIKNLGTDTNCNTPGFYHTWRCYPTISITPIAGKILKLGNTSSVYKDI